MESGTVFIDKQRQILKRAHNAKFRIGSMEYKVKYEGGLAESFGVYGRPIGARNYSFVAGFAGYKLYSYEQVVSLAKEMVRNKSSKI